MPSEQETIRTLSDRLVAAQKPIRILDAIKWTDDIKEGFFKGKAEILPAVDKDYYAKRRLPFDSEEIIAEFRAIIRDTRNQLGQFSCVTKLIESRCQEYCTAIRMLEQRGTSAFSEISMELYGAPDDVFYANGPRLSDLGILLEDVLENLNADVVSEADEKRYMPTEVITILQERFQQYFTDYDKVVVKVSDNIDADAAAGADCIKLNQSVMFSERDIRYLEVHEGWVHVGTTLNGAKQPYCTFLSKGSPASTVTQEGLAVLTEIVTFSSSPGRLMKIRNRVKAIDLVNQGANFIDIYRYFKSQGYSDDESYSYSVRVFRGSAPNLGPFTKDLSYAKGFVMIYNFIRLAVQKGALSLVPLLFVGKVLLEETPILANLLKQGIIVPPFYMPPQFKDLSALSSWMSFSLYLNKFDLKTLSNQFSYL